MNPRMLQVARLPRISACAVAVIALAASVGCAPMAAPPAAPAVLFKLPPVGTSTDTILRIGDNFPQIQAVDLDGNAVTFDKSLLGHRYTLVVFWSTWCGFCMQELPHEVELAKQYERAGLRVIGVNADETTAIAKVAVKEHAVPWLNLFEGPKKSISNALRIKQWPTLILLGPDGKVVCATQQLRANAVQVLPDGSTRTVKGLDWFLNELLDKVGSSVGQQDAREEAVDR
jgi:thiol-disulfide isomerase/thioredoxin